MRKIELCDEDAPDALYDEDLGFYRVVSEGRDDISVICNYPREMVWTINNTDDIKMLNACGYELEGEARVGDCVLAVKSHNKLHIVKPCETVSTLAKLYGITEAELIKQNELKTNKLFIGQTLVIKKHPN